MAKKTLLQRSQEIRLILRENMEFWRNEMKKSNSPQAIENFEMYKKDVRLLDIEIERIKFKK
jgi:hypothetical protein